MATLTGAGLRALRELCGVTQQQMADALDVSVRAVKRWEADTRQVPEGVSEWALMAASEHDMAVEDIVDRVESGVPHGNHVVLSYYRTQIQSDWIASLRGDEKAGPYQVLNAATRSAAEILKAKGYAVSFAYPDEEIVSKNLTEVY